MAAQRICSVTDCDKPSRDLGMCIMHSKRFRKYGDANYTKTAPTGAPKRWLDAHQGYADDWCLIWPFGRMPAGYCPVRVEGKQSYAHVEMCILAHGPKPEGNYEAAHSCGRRDCVNPKHLRWATPLENSADKFVHGTVLRGTGVTNSKLTEEQVIALREALTTRPQSQVARDFGVSQQQVSDIKTGKCWGWLKS